MKIQKAATTGKRKAESIKIVPLYEDTFEAAICKIQRSKRVSFAKTRNANSIGLEILTSLFQNKLMKERRPDAYSTTLASCSVES